jgi:lipopolysaccharide export system permease protein
MKILDRYLLKLFLLPLGVCLAAFTMIWIIIDLFNHLGDFLQGQVSTGAMLQYYLLLIPASLTFLVPVSLILAELYCLARLTRNNELTAMRASGLSLLRLMRPFIATGFVAAVLLLLVNETIAPQAAYRTDQFVRSQKLEDPLSVYIHRALAYPNPGHYRQWFIGEFDARTFELRNVEVVQQDEHDRDLFKITAPQVQWLDGRWWFSDLNIQFYDEHNNPRGAPRMEKGREMPDFTETPQDFLNERLDPKFLGAVQLGRYIRRQHGVTGKTLVRYQVDLHHRLAIPWSALVVTLLALPIGSHTGRRGAIHGVLWCMALFFATYVLLGVGLHAGKEGWIPAWLAGWGPLALFAGYGGILALRLR